ncbi:MAG TPA: hypothetical protein VFR13_02600 [Jiangellaceae bacterium]|nr:hypothetical protein [Jiangellaceae bacterium]
MTEQEWKPQETVQPTGGTEYRIGPILSLVGGAALILGTRMAWATVSTALGTVNISSTEGGDGEAILFLGVVIVVLAGLDLARPGRFWWIGVAVGAGLALLNGVIDFFNVTENIQAEDLEGGGVVSVGAGLYVALLGAAVALAGALLRERSVR